MSCFENGFENTEAVSYETPDIFVPFEEFCKEAVEAGNARQAELNEQDVHSDDADKNLEKAPPMEIQAMEIRDYFVEHPELHFENWKKLDVQERLDALNGLEQHVAEVAKRPPMEVCAEKMPHTWRGYYRHGTGKLCLNIENLQLDDESGEMYRQILSTTFHEGRHAYQHHNIDAYLLGETVVEPDTVLVDAWIESRFGEYGGYKSGDRPSMYAVKKYWENLAADGISGKDIVKMLFPPYSQLGFEEYQQQPVEVDARVFAEQVASTIGV